MFRFLVFLFWLIKEMARGFPGHFFIDLPVKRRTSFAFSGRTRRAGFSGGVREWLSRGFEPDFPGVRMRMPVSVCERPGGLRGRRAHC